MGFVFRLIKNELFSLSTIFLVAIPLITHGGDLSATPLPAIAQSISVPDVNGGVGSLMQMIGGTEASAVTHIVGGHSGGSHGPIYLPEDSRT